MRAKELVSTLAEFLDLPVAYVKVLDRALADNGLRTKGRGRVPPDVTRRDALLLYLAARTAPIATRAHIDAQVWASLRPFEGISVGIGDEERVLSNAFGYGRNAVMKLSLIDAMERICERLATDAIESPYNVQLDLHLTNCFAEFSFHEDTQNETTVVFVGPSTKEKGEMQTIARIYQGTLAWIGRTFPDASNGTGDNDVHRLDG